MTDHPGFNDKKYKARRNEIMQHALDYHLYDEKIPIIDYTKTEQAVWTKVYKRLMKLYENGACTPHLEAMDQMEKHCGFSETNIP